MPRLIYAHDATGKRTCGSLADLIAAIKAGEQVRVFWGTEEDGYGLAVPIALFIRKGHVSGQIKFISSNWTPDGTFLKFDPIPSDYTVAFCTTGAAFRRGFNLQTHAVDDLAFSQGRSYFVGA